MLTFLPTTDFFLLADNYLPATYQTSRRPCPFRI